MIKDKSITQAVINGYAGKILRIDLSTEKISTDPLSQRMCDEFIGAAKRVAKGFELSEETLALDLIDAVGPQGHFMAERHTAENFRKEFWIPELIDRSNFDTWQAQGETSLLDRTRCKVREILESHQPDPLDADVQKHLAELQKNSAWRLRQAQVSFDDNKIKLMGRITHDNITSVLTVNLHPRITELGKLQIRLGTVKAGVLTMPESVVQSQLQKLKDVLREAGRRYPKKDKNDKNSLSTREFLEKLGMVVSEMEKQKLVTIDEVFRAQDKDTRLLAIKISDGKVELALESSWMEDGK